MKDCEWWLYVLLNSTQTKTYVGVSTDVHRRLREHNGLSKRAGAKATRAGRPWTVSAVHGPYTKSEAHKSEYKLKKQKFMRRLTWSDADARDTDTSV